MNQRNLRRLIDHLRKTDRDDFDMAYYINGPDVDDATRLSDVPDVPECGTTACIAGHIILAFREDLNPAFDRIHEAAQNWLGLNDREAGCLFTGGWSYKPMADISLDETLKHLETLIQ